MAQNLSLLLEPVTKLETVANQPFSEAWAKKYLRNLAEQDDRIEVLKRSEIASEVATTLTQALRTTSLQAWGRTEALLSQEVIRHQIDPELIDPWEVAKDTHKIYQTTLSAYAEQISPAKFSTRIARDLGKIRQKYTADDPRVIGFISMQFHYSGQILLNLTPPVQQASLRAYFKVIDDHLYMPLQRAYQAAAECAYDAPPLQAVQKLLPLCSEIATKIAERVMQMYPNYQCHTGRLSDTRVQISSVRDIEMFQVYLWVCVLENNISAVQQELFPLCVMLYPRLKVRWEFVRQLIHLLGTEIRSRLEPQQAAYFLPYYDSLWAMFSPEVLPDGKL
ncbi:hypothetical protein [Nostoc sphaeroides]|uniref:Uncharacterized protein n=1 Tax=Nostoc sphaeroides CCNUC1 TaxID=2653204 RepID=A0A5P8W6W5_9NOSO|nr:hypothetical protein [Nostoc sphaeroides]QFS48505.1 hypothetical protein GXM_05999 [Nostoc sphaeroides CCNUC1]